LAISMVLLKNAGPTLPLDPGQTTSVTFILDASDVGFYDNSGKFIVEPDTIDLYVGNSSSGGLKTSFTVVR
jgi:beta-glucosidase